MMYCQKCKVLTDSSDKCLFCETKKIREPKINDEIYLTTQKPIFSGMFEDLLKQNKIPYLKQGKLGAALAIKAGLFEEYKFFVPFGAYEKSKELLKYLQEEI